MVKIRRKKLYPAFLFHFSIFIWYLTVLSLKFWIQCWKCAFGTCADSEGPSLSAAGLIGYYRMYQLKAKARMRPCACARWCESELFLLTRPLWEYVDRYCPPSEKSVKLFIASSEFICVRGEAEFFSTCIRTYLNSVYFVQTSFCDYSKSKKKKKKKKNLKLHQN